jgi:hypothetical protein
MPIHMAELRYEKRNEKNPSFYSFNINLYHNLGPLLKSISNELK